MGYNTAMIIRNDFTSDIRKDAEFGEAVTDAMAYAGYSPEQQYDNRFEVLPPRHADETQVVIIGQNSIRTLANLYSTPDDDFAILSMLAWIKGYKLVSND